MVVGVVVVGGGILVVTVDRGWDGGWFGSTGAVDDDEDVPGTDSSSLMDRDAKKIPGRNPLVEVFAFSGWMPLPLLAKIDIFMS